MAFGNLHDDCLRFLRTLCYHLLGWCHQEPPQGSCVTERDGSVGVVWRGSHTPHFIHPGPSGGASQGRLYRENGPTGPYYLGRVLLHSGCSCTRGGRCCCTGLTRVVVVGAVLMLAVVELYLLFCHHVLSSCSVIPSRSQGKHLS